MRWGPIVVVAVCGCDVVFRIDRVPRMDASIEIDAGEPCRADYEMVNNAPPDSRYFFSDMFLSWAAAEEDCEDDSITGITHLVVIDDLTELRAVRSFVIAKRIEQTGVGGFDAWAGHARDAASAMPLQFFAVTGEPLPASGPPWELNEPNNLGSNEPVVWFNDHFDLIDGATSLRLQSVCECDHRPVTQQFVLD